MTSFCTYCSATKSTEPGKIPAISRYDSPRIKRVYEASKILGLPFRILSGKYGLVPPEWPIPHYDHLLGSAEIKALAHLVAQQISTDRITAFVYFTKPLATSQDLVPYHDTLATACRDTSISFFVVELE